MPFSQVALNRRCRSYVLSSRPVMCSHHSLELQLAEMVCPTAHQPHSLPSTCTYAHDATSLSLECRLFALSIGPVRRTSEDDASAGRTDAAALSPRRRRRVQANYAGSESTVPRHRHYSQHVAVRPSRGRSTLGWPIQVEASLASSSSVLSIPKVPSCVGKADRGFPAF